VVVKKNRVDFDMSEVLISPPPCPNRGPLFSLVTLRHSFSFFLSHTHSYNNAAFRFLLAFLPRPRRASRKKRRARREKRAGGETKDATIKSRKSRKFSSLPL